MLFYDATRATLLDFSTLQGCGLSSNIQHCKPMPSSPPHHLAQTIDHLPHQRNAQRLTNDGLL